MAVERKYRITFEGSDQQISKLGKLEQQLTEVNEELKEQKRILKESKGTNSQAAESVARLSQEQKRLRGESSKVSREVQTQDKALKANSKTIEGMRRKVSDLTRQWAKAEIGTEDFKQLERQLDETTKELLQYERAVGKSQRNVGNYTTSLGKLKAGFGKLALGITAGIALLGSLSATAGEAIHKIDEQVKAEKSLETALGRVSVKLKDQAKALQEVTRFGDEQIIAQQAFLASLGFSEEKIQDIISASVDLASATGQSLDFAVRNLSKTYSGLTGELGELIPELKNFTKEELQAGAAVEYATTQFAGQAEAMRSVGAGELESFNNIMGDLTETIGGLVVSALNPFVSSLSDAVSGLDKFINRSNTESNRLRAVKSELNATFEVLKKNNESNDVRAQLIASINKKYGEYLPNLLDESSSITDIQVAQDAANKSLERKIVLMATEEILAEKTRKAADIQKKIIEQQISLEKELADGRNRSSQGFLADTEGTLEIAKQQNLIKVYQEQLQAAQEDLQKFQIANQDLISTIEPILNGGESPTGGGGTTPRGGESIEQIDPFEAPEVIQAREVGAILVGIENDTQEAIRKSKEETYAFEEEMRIARKKADLQEAALKLNLASTVFHGVAALLKQGSKEAKALALIGIAIDTAKGIASATAAGAGIPFPGNLPAITTGVGVVLGNMAAAKNVLKGNNEDGGILEKFATGGVLKGKRHSQGGIQMFGRGGYFGEAEGGEAIINRRSTAMFKPVLSALNAAGGGRTFANGGELGRPQLPTSFGSLFNSDEFVEGIVNGINAKQVFLNMTDVNSFQSDIQLTETEVSF